jgi:protein subunit release factor B
MQCFPCAVQSRLVRSSLALTHTLAVSWPLWTAMRLSHTHSAVVKRPSRRRYAASNTRGRVSQAKDLLEVIKAKPQDEAKAFFDKLLPRDRLDVVRFLHEKRRKRKSDRGSSALPKYYSTIFEKNYFFKEEEVTEESTLGRGPGGQATNRRMQTAIVRHVPSDIIVKFSRFPSLWLNRRAARELLNLRLEEHLLGPASRLGKARAAKERRQRRRQRTVDYLTRKGSRLQARATHECHWAAFLEGTAPLPDAATQQMGLTGKNSQPVTVALLFGAECNSWWPKLKTAVDTGAAAATTDGNDGNGSALVPLMLRYLFPATYACADGSEHEQLEKCKSSTVARTNVSRAFVCFCELFGLRLRYAAAPSSGASQPRCLLQKDGLNWVEYRVRMQEDGKLTLVGQICWPHVYVSLRELDMLAEARAVVVFFKKEAKAEGSNMSAVWAQEALACLTQALHESKTGAVRDTHTHTDGSASDGDTAGKQASHPTTT